MHVVLGEFPVFFCMLQLVNIDIQRLGIEILSHLVGTEHCHHVCEGFHWYLHPRTGVKAISHKRNKFCFRSVAWRIVDQSRMVDDYNDSDAAVLTNDKKSNFRIVSHLIDPLVAIYG